VRRGRRDAGKARRPSIPATPGPCCT